MIKFFTVLQFLLSFSTVFLIVSVESSRVNIVNNGYNNLVVAIDPEVKKSQSVTIIANIKKMMLEASYALYRATEDRAYFRSVHILIPESWDHIEANLSSWETFKTADVIVDDYGQNQEYDVPFTQQNGKCGDPGEVIHLSANYVNTIDREENINKFGYPGKVFVHEWAHYRYGVFDEYGRAGHPNYPLFYRPPFSKEILPNLCSNEKPVYSLLDLKLNSTNCVIDPNTQTYNHNCKFILDPNFKPLSSLASMNFIDSVVHFCRDDPNWMTHNFNAPNKHNAMCGGASVWSVIMRSPDFINNRNPPIDLQKIDMQFHIVKPSELRIVIAFDVSSCMGICNRIEKLGLSIRSWIKNDLPSGSKLGMVMFSSMAHIVSELTLITDMKSRYEMMDKVPSELFSDTCIGCGLALATRLLAEAGKGGIILLVTAGENTPGCLSIADVESEILEAEIRVITIAVGNKADRGLEHLAALSDGKTYFIHDSDTSYAFNDAFQGALTFQPNISDSNLYFKLYEQKVKTVVPRVINGEFIVDNTVGRNLIFSVFDVEKKSLIANIRLLSPDGEEFNKIEFDSNTAVVFVKLAKPGYWYFTVELKGKQSYPILLSVVTQLLPEVETPISTRCWASSGESASSLTVPVKIYAEVLKGKNSVLGATVMAYIEKPNEEVQIIELLDNGVYADTTANDGVYSRYFSNTTQKGRYSIKCQVSQTGKAYENLGFIASHSPYLDTNIVYSGNTRNRRNIPNSQILVGNFSRISSGGSFQIETPVLTEDAYPPGDVTDLSALLISETETEVSIQLTWTAPGDEFDTGKVTFYEIKYSDNAADLINSNFDDKTTKRNSLTITEDDVEDGSLQPEEAGYSQFVLVVLSNIQRDKPYYVALRAIDKAKKISRVSNMAAFFVPVKPEPTDSKSTNQETEEVDITENLDDLKNLGVYGVVLIVSSISGLVIVVGLGIYFLFLYLRKIHRQKNETYTAVPLA